MANQKGKSKYTRAQKRAYYSGMGYATAYHNKAIKFDTPENRSSFEAGWKQGTAMARSKPDKYPPAYGEEVAREESEKICRSRESRCRN